MSKVDGSWNIDVASPLGSLRFVLDLAAAGSKITGKAAGDLGEFIVQEGETTPDGAKFSVDVKALPMALALKLRVDGDSLSGQAKAGKMTAKVTGARAK